MWDSLTTYVPQVQKRVCPTAPFGVSLRLSNASASTLVKSKPERDKLKSFLADNDMYLYTVNAFPYGPFKNQIVKEQVYEPDWRSEERTQYTMNVAEILADVVPAAISPSIQSAPLGFKPQRHRRRAWSTATPSMCMRVAAHLIDLEKRTGRTVTLALEPEPFCFLETTDETVDYFTNHLYTGKSAEMLAKLVRPADLGGASSRSGSFIGMVFDICHQAVEYEDIAVSLQKLVDAGIPIFKLQEAAAMRIPNVTQKIVDTLRRYAKTIYLTQTVEKKDGKLNRFLNLEDAFKAWESDPGPREWRTHFHVPVFLDDLGEFGTTRFAIEDALQVPQGEAAVAPARDRDLHLGRAAGSSEDRRHRRLRLARNRVGERSASVVPLQ